MAACTKQAVGLVDRACDVGQCVAGYACLDGVCRPFAASGGAGGQCDEANAVSPCVAGTTDCSQGCRQCVGGVWGECLYDCLLSGRAFIRDESCNGRDDDCDGAVDEATDSPQGCVDRFLDMDGDGRGAGEARCACDDADDGYSAVTGDDCDDRDARVFPGASNECFACETYVAKRTDDDGDGVDECGGDCNDASSAASPAILEDVAAGNCRDGLDNDCNTGVDCGDKNCVVEPALFRYGRVVTVTPNPTLAAGFGIAFAFDHLGLYNAGRTTSNGADVRVFVRDSGGFREVPRELDVASGWLRSDTRLWIRNEHVRTAAETDVLLVYGAGPNVTTSASTATGVYALRDDFDAPGSVLGSPWTVAGSAIAKGGGLITLPSPNTNANPVADRSFPNLEGGRVELKVGIVLVTPSSDSDYGAFIHLGRNLPAMTPPVNAVGAAAVLGWGAFPNGTGPNFGAERFVGIGGGDSFSIGSGTGSRRLSALIDLDAKTVLAAVDGFETAITFGDNAVGNVNVLRLSGWQILTANLVRFDYVGVRAAPPAEALTTVGPELAIGPCP